MPIELPPLSRRKFLAAATVAAGVSLFDRAGAWAADAGEIPADPHRLALFSDTHIDANSTIVERGSNMTDHLRWACGEVMKLPARPGQLIVNGDLAFRDGTVGDYEQSLALLKPIREAGVPIHIGMGNHDNRANFWKAVPAEDPATMKRLGDSGKNPPLKDRQVGVFGLPRANGFLLDSLIETNKTPGQLGADQLAWLTKELDARPGKPALVFVHHNPIFPITASLVDPRAVGRSLLHGSLTDTDALLAVLSPRKHVKALIFGHTHAWGVNRSKDGIHWINLPPLGYAFEAGLPMGWVDLQLQENGAALELHCTDPKHPNQGEKVKLDWRAS